MADGLGATPSLTVDQYAGSVFTEMWHATKPEAAEAIIRSQRFKPSTGGLLGPGIYLTRKREKAEAYRKPGGSWYRGGQEPQNDGVLLKCRVKLGACKEFRRGCDASDRALLETWHDRADRAGHRYNSAWAEAGVLKAMGGDHLDENCVWNADRIDQIEVVDGFGPSSRLNGSGREFWATSQSASTQPTGQAFDRTAWSVVSGRPTTGHTVRLKVNKNGLSRGDICRVLIF